MHHNGEARKAELSRVPQLGYEITCISENENAYAMLAACGRLPASVPRSVSYSSAVYE